MSSHLTTNIAKTVLEFVADLKNNIFIEPTEQGDLLIVEFSFKVMPSESIANHVVSHILPHGDRIRKRDIGFFMDKKKEVFAGLPLDRVDYFSSIVLKPANAGGLSEEDKEVIWSYFDTLLGLAEEYKKKK